jgi:glutathione S-transferase
MVISPIQLQVAKYLVARGVRGALKAQGTGRLPYDAMVEAMKEDLRDVSKALGGKSFFFGERPTEADAAVFGFLAQVIWAAPGSPYEVLIKGRLKGLFKLMPFFIREH